MTLGRAGGETAGTMRFLAGGLVAALLAVAAHPVAAQPLDRLGAIGDSLTDEYDDQNFGGYARNWLELLAEERGVDLGPTAAQAGQPGGTWGEPRRTGYQENFARSSADSSTAIAQGQHTGVAGGAARGVDHVVVFIGNNDFRPTFPPGDNGFPYNAIYNGAWSPAQIEAHLDQILDNLRTILAPLQAAGQRLVVASAFDFGATPSVRLVFTDATKRERVSAVVASLAARVRALAAEKQVAFVDLFALGRAMFGTNLAPRATLAVGNVAIQLDATSTTSGDTDAFVEDGVHPHTVVQGIIANAFVTALDRAYGSCISPFTEAELLAHNGLAYGGSDTLSAVIGGYEAYVASYAGGRSLRFHGNGSSAPTLDRVTVRIDGPPRPADIGATSFTLELWMKAAAGANGSSVACTAASDAWIEGNIVVDRDVWGPGDHGDFGLSLMNGRVAFGVHNGANGETVCGTSDLRDGRWHHVAVTRRSSDGVIELFVDGVRERSVNSVNGDLSYRDGRAGQTWDPYLVFGAEKHDAGPAYPSFSGWLDEIRLSQTRRYTTATFVPPSAPFAADVATFALWSFDEGAGTSVCDRSGAAGGPSDGERRVGGNPQGPAWSTDTPFGAPIFLDGFETGGTARWSS